jgi:alkyl hydroperoxide reductase subunit AhpF
MFRPDEERAVREHLAGLTRAVELALVLGPEEQPVPGAREIDFSGEARRLLEELVALGGGRLTFTVHEDGAGRFGVERFPAICVLPEATDPGVRYYGLPWGYELTSILGACVEAGRVESSLTPDSRSALAGLTGDVSIDVFVTPT